MKQPNDEVDFGDISLMDDILTSEDHLQLAAETKANSLSLEEVRKALDEQLAELKAKRQAGILI